MTVKELIEALVELGADSSIVVMASDGEGNSYSPLDRCWSGAYRAETTWSGEVGFTELTPELESYGYSEDDVVDGVPAVVLCPTN